MESKLPSAGIDFDAACQTGLLPEDNTKSPQALGLSYVGQSISFFDLQQRLPKSSLWVCGQWSRFGLPVRLVIAASEEFVEYFDPCDWRKARCH
jgi:hypothetical protein